MRRQKERKREQRGTGRRQSSLWARVRTAFLLFARARAVGLPWLQESETVYTRATGGLDMTIRVAFCSTGVRSIKE